jgi:hypothetical protein
MQRNTQTPTLESLRQAIQTATLAKLTNYKPDSIRTALWRNGHFQGIKPIRTPSGRLLWPADAVERLLSGEGLQ